MFFDWGYAQWALWTVGTGIVGAMVGIACDRLYHGDHIRIGRMIVSWDHTPRYTPNRTGRECDCDGPCYCPDATDARGVRYDGGVDCPDARIHRDTGPSDIA